LIWKGKRIYRREEREDILLTRKEKKEGKNNCATFTKIGGTKKKGGADNASFVLWHWMLGRKRKTTAPVFRAHDT